MLYPFRVSGPNHAVIVTEDSQAPQNCLSQPVMVHPMVLHFHGQLCPDEIFHDHVEECQIYKLPYFVPRVAGNSGL